MFFYVTPVEKNLATSTRITLRVSLVAQSVESDCNAGDLGLIPGSGRSPGEGNGNPLQYSCLETPTTEEPGRLQSTGSESNTTERLNTHTKVTNTLIFGWEDPLEKGKATHSSILAWRIPWAL